MSRPAELWAASSVLELDLTGDGQADSLFSSAVMNAESAPTAQPLWYIAYGANLHPKLLAGRLGSAHKPLERVSVRIPLVYLTFNFRGIAELEPVYSNATIRVPGHAGRLDRAGETDEEARERVWGLSCPGLDYTGDLPPCLEGVAFRLTQEHFDFVMSPGSTPPSDSPVVMHQVDCDIFNLEERVTGTLQGWLPVVVDPRYLTATGVQPSLRYLRLVLIGSFFAVLSQPFISHLVLLRHAVPSQSLVARLKRMLYVLIMLPGFLGGVMPRVLLAKVLSACGVKVSAAGSAGTGAWGKGLIDLLETRGRVTLA